MPDSNSGSVGETGRTPELPDGLSRFEVMNDWLVVQVDQCNCATPDPAMYGHEAHCQYEPIMTMAELAIVLARAGRTVVQLPEPDETYTDSVLRARWSLCTAIVGGNGPKVSVLGGPYLDPDVAESRGTELIAAARLARRLAAESSGDGAE